MRRMDWKKKERIFDALLRSINKDGIANLRMAKLAKDADVSPATIYMHFENKDIMLHALYKNVQQHFIDFLTQNIEDLSPKEAVKQIWYNFYHFVIEFSLEYFFTEELYHASNKNLNSTFDTLFSEESIQKLFEKLLKDKEISNNPINIVYALFFAPIEKIAKREIKKEETIIPSTLENIFNNCWRNITEK